MIVPFIIAFFSVVLALILVYLWSKKAHRRDGFVVGAMLLGFLAFVMLLIGGINQMEAATCRRQADGYGLGSEFDVFAGCRVYIASGQLVPIDAIRINDDGEIIVGSDE
jgi:hypothetical protein